MWQAPDGKTVWLQSSTWGIYADYQSDGFPIYVISGGGSASHDSAPDAVYAEGGDDRVIGGYGNDYISGGTGGDTLWGQKGDDVIDGGDGGDTVIGDGTIRAGFHQTFDIAGDDYLLGGSGNDVMYGDYMEYGGETSETEMQYRGNDALEGGSGNDTLYGQGGDDILRGGDGNDRLKGGTGNDTLYGGYGNDSLWAGLGDDTLNGGEGDDIYYIEAGSGTKHIVDHAGANTLVFQGDIDLSSIHLSLGSLKITTGIPGDEIHLDDIDYDDLINTASIGTVRLSDGQSLTLAELVATVGIDIAGTNENDALQGTSARDNLLGLDGDDTLWGGGGDDVLEGGAGADTLAGGVGDDRYIVMDMEDTFVESEGEGSDTVETLFDNFVLGSNLENLTLAAGSSAITAQGNALDNRLEGNELGNQLSGFDGNDTLLGGAGDDVLLGGSGGDVLDGGSGADQMAGGTGDDTYIVGDADDVVVEAEGEGVDIVNCAFSISLSANVEYLMLVGESDIDGHGNADGNVLIGNGGENRLYGLGGNDELHGNEGNDTLDGGDGNDRLDGGKGIDSMAGGTGDDIYEVDQSGDLIVENIGEGIDLVRAKLGYTLSANVENLILDEVAGHADAIGNSMANHLTGNDYDNRLDGGGGTDVLEGGSGDDIYVVDDAGDQIIEAESGGSDDVEASVSYTLSSNLEELALTGTANIDGTGNELDNNLQGNAGANRLDGGGGSDRLSGDAGDDTYFTGTGDWIYEYGDEGDDTEIRAYDSYFHLSDNVENLTLVGEALHGRGNELDNVLTGNDADNLLMGFNGSDTLVGGLGNDYLVGGEGADVYVFARGDGQDFIDDRDVAEGFDTLRFEAGIAETDVTVVKYGNSLFFKIKNSGDQIGISNYFAATEDVEGIPYDQKIDRVEFADGTVWDQTEIQTQVDRAINNHAPTVNTYLPTLQARAASPFTYTVAANTITDPDPWDSVTYSAKMQDGSALPSWLSFDPVSRTFSGTPGAGDVGTLRLMLWGTDSYGYAMGEYVTLNIGAANRAPVLATPLADQTAAEGGAFGYTVPANAFTDPDSGDSLTYSATLADGNALPAWLTFNTATRAFGGTPPTGSTGTISVKVTAKDTGNLSVSDAFDLVVSVQNLTLNGTSGANTLNGGAGNDTLNGNAGNDTLNGNAGNDTLNGGTGNDTMRGGLGNDTYVVDSASDVVTENANEGTDLVQSSVTLTLAANVENLTLTGTSAIKGTGNALDNVLTGNGGNNTLTGGAGNDRIDGGSGSDTMLGGSGDDIYYVNVKDPESEASGYLA